MSKASELNDARLQGMNYALKQIKANGIEAFEAEMKWRAGIRIGVNIKPQELNEAAHKIREKLDATMRAMALIAGGMSYFQTGKQLGIPKGTLSGWRRKGWI